MKKIKKYLSPILLIIAAMIWGFAFSAQKAAEAVPPLTIGAVRSLFAAVFLIFVVIIFLLLVKIFLLDARVAKLEDKLTKLAQKYAIDNENHEI